MILKQMLDHNMPLTRERYISMSYGPEGPPKFWGPDLEGELPEPFRKKEE